MVPHHGWDVGTTRYEGCVVFGARRDWVGFDSRCEAMMDLTFDDAFAPARVAMLLKKFAQLDDERGSCIDPSQNRRHRSTEASDMSQGVQAGRTVA